MMIFHLHYQLANIFERGTVMMGNLTHTEKLKFEKKAQYWLKLKNCGWFGVRIENIQSDPPKEVS